MHSSAESDIDEVVANGNRRTDSALVTHHEFNNNVGSDTNIKRQVTNVGSKISEQKFFKNSADEIEPLRGEKVKARQQCHAAETKLEFKSDSAVSAARNHLSVYLLPPRLERPAGARESRMPLCISHDRKPSGILEKESLQSLHSTRTNHVGQKA